MLDRLRQEGIVVRAACWVKPSDRDRWSLYIATPGVKAGDTLAAYRQLTPVMRSLGDDWITSSDVVVVEEHPLVQDAHYVLRRFPHTKPIQSPRPLLGGISVDEVYVYPLGQVEVTLYHLIFPGRGEPGIMSLDPSLLNGQFSMEAESTGERKRYEGKTGVACVVAAPEGAKLERDESGDMVLAWDLHGTRTRSTANEVWSLAKLGLHRFRFLREPDAARTSE